MNHDQEWSALSLFELMCQRKKERGVRAPPQADITLLHNHLHNSVHRITNSTRRADPIRPTTLVRVGDLVWLAWLARLERGRYGPEQPQRRRVPHRKLGAFLRRTLRHDWRGGALGDFPLHRLQRRRRHQERCGAKPRQCGCLDPRSLWLCRRRRIGLGARPAGAGRRLAEAAGEARAALCADGLPQPLEVELLRALCLAQGGGAAHAQHILDGRVELSGGEMPLQAARAGEGGGSTGAGVGVLLAGRGSRRASGRAVRSCQQSTACASASERSACAHAAGSRSGPGRKAASRACSCAGSESKAAPTP